MPTYRVLRGFSMSSTRSRFLQARAGDLVTPAELVSTGLTSTQVKGTAAWTVVSFNNSTRVVTLVPAVNDLRDWIVPGYIMRFTGSTPANSNYYTIETMLSANTFRTVETPPSSLTGGTITLYYPSGATISGYDSTGRTILAGHTHVQQCLNTLDTSVGGLTTNVTTLTNQSIKIYNSSGIITNPKKWVGRVQNNTGTSALTVNYASAGFTTVYSVVATAERNTTLVSEVPIASIRSYTTTSAIIQFVDSAGILIGGQGLEFTTSNGNFVHLEVTGI